MSFISGTFQQLILAQLGFLWRLCQRNSDVIQVLKGETGIRPIGVHLKFDMIIAALKNKKLKKWQPKIRAMMIMLVQGKS